ncbi:hypothetical protein RND81_05G124800 [Saponaria officinalis]|uniref:Uncharacterized protein n=1 Tax=Saponaria officinalis TaxID=3572 RepID=A0AAW1KRX8_SAPOF
MIRTRLAWFTTGFAVAGISIASLIHRDLSKDRLLLLAQLEDNFGALQARVSSLEFVPRDTSDVQVLFDCSNDVVFVLLLFLIECFEGISDILLDECRFFFEFDRSYNSLTLFLIA